MALMSPLLTHPHFTPTHSETDRYIIQDRVMDLMSPILTHLGLTPTHSETDSRFRQDRAMARMSPLLTSRTPIHSEIDNQSGQVGREQSV